MRPVTVVGLALVLCLAASVALADQPAPEKFVIELSTEVTALPFTLPSIPGFEMPDLNAPKHLLSGQAHYPTAAVEPIWVTVPATLAQPENRLPLHVYKPGAPVEEEPGEETPDATPSQPRKFKLTLKLYWHPDVAHGPLTETTEMSVPAGGGAMPGPGAAMPPMTDWEAELDKIASGSTEELPLDAAGQGNYVLNTGGLTATLDGFLPPLKISQPGSLAELDLTQPITVQWKPVPGARGFILHAMAMYSEAEAYTVVQWVSTLNEPPERVKTDYEQATTIADDLANGVLLPPETTSCVVPGGLFPANAQMFMLDVIAVGNDFYSQAEGATVVGKIRSKWTGMKMSGMGMLPGGLPPMDLEDEEG
ncbi:MAG: hypothetical protein GX100_00160 [candidate division WS1 bacterium]|nr:hypothetical protein [candidate division WS1 bacterium]